MTTRFQKLHITSRLISAYLLQCSQIPINTLFCQLNSLFANTEMYEAVYKLRNNRIIYAIFIHEYGVNFHELYIATLQCTSVYTNIPTCRRGESKISFPLNEGIFVYSRVFVQ